MNVVLAGNIVANPPILYSFRRCPYAMRARMALLASEQIFELREIALANKPADMLQVSPKGTVPVLLLPTGEVIDQSLEIMQWALNINDPQCWLPPDTHYKIQMQHWINQCDGLFKFNLDRYKYPNRFGLHDGLAHRTKGAEFLSSLEQHLAVQGCLGHQTFSMIDAAMAPFVRQFAHTSPDWFANQSWPRLQSWLAAFKNAPLFLCAMAKNPVWKSADVPCFRA
jgi:glutathione S-transferase